MYHMDMEKIEDHIKNIFVIIILFILTVICLFLLCLLVDNLLSEFQVFSVGNVLAFSGAVIGGGLTLWGVLLTIKHQQRKDILDRYPKRLKYADDVHESLKNIYINIYNYSEQGHYAMLQKYLGDSPQNEKDMILEKASSVNHGCYIKTVIFFNYLKMLSAEMAAKLINREKNQLPDHVLIEHSETFKSKIISIERGIKSYEEEYLKLKREHNRISGIKIDL